MASPPTLTVVSRGEDTVEFEDRFLPSYASSRYTLRYGIC